MKTVEAYRCADGSLFDSERAAAAHEEDLLGQELDGLLMLCGIANRHDQFKYALALLSKENRAALVHQCRRIVEIVEHSDPDSGD